MLYPFHTDTTTLSNATCQLLDLAIELESVARDHHADLDGAYTTASNARLAAKYLAHALASLAELNARVAERNVGEHTAALINAAIP